MGISSTTNRVVLAGNGSSAVFNFPYYFFSQTDLVVYTYDTVLDSSFLQVLNTNYSIVGTQNTQGLYTTGANVVMNSSPNSTTDVIIIRNPPRVQNYALLQNGTISSAALVQEMDYLTLLIQRLEDKAVRSVRLEDGFGGTFDTTIPIQTPLNPGAALIINSSGTGFVTGSSLFQGTAGYLLTGNGPGVNASFQPVTLSGSSVSGTLSLSNGGTGGLAPQEWGVVFASSSTQLATTNPGPSGLPLISVASSAPAFAPLNLANAVTGLLPLPNITPGTTGQVLTTGSGNVLSWQVASAAASGAALIGNNLSDMSNTSTAFKNISPMTTTGDVIIYGSNSLQVRLAAGNANQVLTANGAGTQPAWVTNITGSGALQISQYVSGSGALQIGNNLSDVASPSQAIKNIAPTTTWGDIFYAGSGNIQTRLAAGTSGNVLQTGGAGAAPSWIAVATGSSLTNPMTTAGDMITGGSAGVAQRLAGSISSSSAVLIQTGSGGVSAQPIWTPVSPPLVQVLNSSGTYSLPTGALGLEVTVVGPGGGGGGTASTVANSGAGGGGGGGATAIKYLSGSTLLSSYSFVVGIGGAGAAAGANAGTSGSSSFFGTIISTGGGGGGAASQGTASNVSSGPGAGGTTTTGDINIIGAGGQSGLIFAVTTSLNGQGGSSFLAGAPAQQSVGSGANASGTAGASAGGGGNGGAQCNNGGTAGGGKGGDGRIIVKVYFVL